MLLEGVLHLSHFGDEIGELYEAMRRASAGDDDMDVVRPVSEGVEDFVEGEPVEGERVGELV